MAAIYLGGAGFDQATSVAIGPDRDIYIGGATESTDFPTSAGAFQATPGRRSCGIPRLGQDICKDGFVGRFSPDLVARRYVTYLRETDPSCTTTSQVGSRPISTWSWPISMGVPEAGTRRSAAMVRRILRAAAVRRQPP